VAQLVILAPQVLHLIQLVLDLGPGFDTRRGKAVGARQAPPRGGVAGQARGSPASPGHSAATAGRAHGGGARAPPAAGGRRCVWVWFGGCVCAALTCCSSVVMRDLWRCLRRARGRGGRQRRTCGLCSCRSARRRRGRTCCTSPCRSERSHAFLTMHGRDYSTWPPRH
jgi:hypothetical protein